MRALMSLCNVGAFNSQFSLFSVDLDRDGLIELVDCTGFIDPRRDAGVTGMLRLADGGLVLCVQSASPRVVFLDAELKVRRVVRDERFMDLHSLSQRDGFVFVTSTGNNKIFRISLLPFGVSLFWEYPVETPYLHINAVAFDGERPVVVSHKIPPECEQEQPSAGCWRLDDFEVLLSGLKQPHTLDVTADGGVDCLSSNDGRLVSWRGGAVSERCVGGYLRGMARIQDRLLIASSSRRFVSRKKEGAPPNTDFSDVIANPAYMSSLVVCDPDGAPRERIDTTVAGFEIYDVVGGEGLPSDRLRSAAGAIRMQTMQRLLVSQREQALASQDAPA